MAARPQFLRVLNEATLISALRQNGRLRRAELAEMSGLSKPTIALALTNLQEKGLVRVAGRRTGVPGPVALVYELRPEAGFVVALDVGSEYLRGALSDLTGTVRARNTRRVHAASSHARTAQLISLAEELMATAGISAEQVTQTVIGSPGVYDQRRDALRLARLPGWERPGLLAELRQAFGSTAIVENDVNLATLAEREHGHGKQVETFALVSIGTGVGVGLVLDGRPFSGAHGAAGEVGFMSLDDEDDAGSPDTRRRGALDAAASADGIVRAARHNGMTGRLSAKRIFEAAAAGDQRAAGAVQGEMRLVARMVANVTAVIDPALVVLGGGVGSAPGFAEAVAAQVAKLVPIVPEIRTSALGNEAIVKGGLAAGVDLAWQRVLDRH